jgi:formylglycine-generating enzyme required for sulfatase activity
VAQYAAALQWAYERSLVEVSGDGKEVLDRKGTNLMELGKHNSQIVFGAAGFTVKAGQGAFPAPYVSWYGAVSCCNWLSEMEGFEPCYDLSVWTCDFSRSGYRLPTEAEWEFAARSGYEGMRFPWSDTNVITHSRANYKAGPKPGEELAPPYDASPTLGLHPDYANNKPPSSPVGAFAPNNYGLVDMCGNVWEWVWDWSARYLPGHQVNPVGPETGTHAIFRGGSWQTTAERETVASRYRSAGRAAMIEDVGFRVVMSLREAPPGAAPSP